MRKKCPVTYRANEAKTISRAMRLGVPALRQWYKVGPAFDPFKRLKKRLYSLNAIGHFNHS